jgi:6-pyruvoyltetrahydropterin/6-carboxytetrahydropterin synthase
MLWRGLNLSAGSSFPRSREETRAVIDETDVDIDLPLSVYGHETPRKEGERSGAAMFEIERERTFSASHQLRNYKGRCERLHGHNWRVRVCLVASAVNPSGMVMDFHELDEMIARAIEPFDHRHLNDINNFRKENPSAENLARAIGDAVRAQLKDPKIKMRYCDVWENDLSRARYIPD